MSSEPQFVFFAAVLFSFLNRIEAIDCIKKCKDPDYTNPNFKPQDCTKLCPSDHFEDKDDDRIEDLMAEVRILKILFIVILIVILLLIVIAFLFLKSNKISCFLFKYWKRWQKKADVEKHQAQTNVVKLENRSNAVKEDDCSLQEVKSSGRKRSPSESTCPEDANEGFDNLGLSSSTLTFHSRPSSPESPTGVGLSLATLNTTTTTIQLDTVNTYPDISRENCRISP